MQASTLFCVLFPDSNHCENHHVRDAAFDARAVFKWAMRSSGICCPLVRCPLYTDFGNVQNIIWPLVSRWPAPFMFFVLFCFCLTIEFDRSRTYFTWAAYWENQSSGSDDIVYWYACNLFFDKMRCVFSRVPIHEKYVLIAFYFRSYFATRFFQVSFGFKGWHLFAWAPNTTSA